MVKIWDFFFIKILKCSPCCTGNSWGRIFLYTPSLLLLSPTHLQHVKTNSVFFFLSPHPHNEDHAAYRLGSGVFLSPAAITKQGNTVCCQCKAATMGSLLQPSPSIQWRAPTLLAVYCGAISLKLLMFNHQKTSRWSRSHSLGQAGTTLEVSI